MTKDQLGAFRLDRKPAAKPFHYKMSGLNNVWLLNGFHEEQTVYGRGFRVEDADGLHRVLAHVIVSDKAVMQGPELRFVRKLMGLSQNGLARLLGCSDQRVARWEKGQTHIDPSAERLVRMIVREWLGENYALKAALNELAELDEALHGGRKLEWRDTGWQKAA